MVLPCPTTMTKCAAQRLLLGLYCVLLTVHGQHLDSLSQPTKPACVEQCLRNNRGCRDCVKQLTTDMLMTPKNLKLEFHKAHPTLADPEVKLTHHNFLDRPPWAPGSVNTHHGRSEIVAEGKVHENCPAMKARTKAAAVLVKFPYTVRFFRSGTIEFECHWINDTYIHRQEIVQPVDSPWMRLPQTHMQIFTVGDSRADVWILNSGLFLDDAHFMSSPTANANDKGGSTGNKWMVLPIPHKKQPLTWTVEQGILSSFQRISKNINIPLQLNFTQLAPDESFIEIKRGTPMLQYVPVVIPTLEIVETPMSKELEDYVVMLSVMHKGGDMRVLKEKDVGAYDVMRSYQLKENPGYVQKLHQKKRVKQKNTEL
eukprot:m.170601 g.170601  ORF g.170601 m.170601 type:complete len:370 (-) comp31615_c0_seq5:66-1175(-)